MRKSNMQSIIHALIEEFANRFDKCGILDIKRKNEQNRIKQ